MRALETKEENSRAVRNFRERLQEVASNLEDMVWGFPNGERATYPTYSINTHLGEIQIGVPESWDTRVPHLIRFTREQGPPSPDVEINIPIEHDRKVSGLYVQSGNEYWLCSRGSFTSFRGQIKREFTFTHFDKWLVQISDMGKLASVIPVCSLASSTIANNIATFVAAVQELKQAHKEIEEQPEIVVSSSSLTSIYNWGKGAEFEGKKTAGGGPKNEYEYLHGPLCNQLMVFLGKAIASNKSVFVTNNVHVDVAIVDKVTQRANAIFEVKTSALPSAQVYSAVGQIYYYKYRYGHSETKLYLVLPSSCKSTDTQYFIESLGIAVIYGESGVFNLPNGESFAVSV
ncbi:hypothetical protein [Nitrosomonas sp. Nm34]|uniref:hypothetical protein n=1 Tax=Nitrosomonas sp. Nm34 TaxID=1881055 RepID=UPI0008E7318B|nr:hypothetical protein [Nitrosomonas sp. Nm34]SFI44184.1 hypothetical protein SAMN05428978_101026 [Nitrosomonas sp. Nm34]